MVKSIKSMCAKFHTKIIILYRVKIVNKTQHSITFFFLSFFSKEINKRQKFKWNYPKQLIIFQNKFY